MDKLQVDVSAASMVIICKMTLLVQAPLSQNVTHVANDLRSTSYHVVLLSRACIETKEHFDSWG